MKLDIKQIKSLKLAKDEYLFIQLEKSFTMEKVKKVRETLASGFREMASRIIVHNCPLKFKKIKIPKGKEIAK